MAERVPHAFEELVRARQGGAGLRWAVAGAQIEFFCRRKLEDKLFFESLVLEFF